MKTTIALILMLFNLSANADFINTGSKYYYGTIIYIDNNKVELQENCNGTVYEFKWTQNIAYIQFNERCVHPGWEQSISPIEAECTQGRTSLYLIVFKNVSTQFYCNSISYGKNGFLFTLFDGRTYLYKNLIKNRDVETLLLKAFCNSEIKMPDFIPPFLVRQ